MAKWIVAGLTPVTYTETRWIANGVTAGPTGWSITATTDTGGGVSPSGNTVWFKAAGSSAAVQRGLHPNNAITALDWAWILGEWYVEDLPSGGSSDYYLIDWLTTAHATTSWRLGIRQDSDTTYKAILREDDGTVHVGSTSFNENTLHALRVQLGSGGLKVWVTPSGGSESLEIDESGVTDKVNNQIVRMQFTANAAGMDTYYANWCMAGGDAEADRPAYPANAYLLTEDGDYASQQNHGDDAACGSGSTSGVAADVALSSNVWNTSIFWCDASSDTGAQGVELTSASPTEDTQLGPTILVATNRGGAGKNAGFKMDVWDADGTVEESPEFVFTGTSWTSNMWSYPDDPDGDSDHWESFSIADLKAGVNHTGSSGNSQMTAAVAVLFWAVDDDPPATAARRISASGMV